VGAVLGRDAEGAGGGGMKVFLFLLLLLPFKAFGEERLAVLNLQGGVKEGEAQYLTELLRGYASRHTRYMVLTRENVEALVEPGVLEKCVNQCEVKVGRLLGSHRVISGVMFGGSRLILKLHNTKSGALIRSVSVSGSIEDRLESSFLELMGLEESSFEELEARYIRMKEELVRREEEEERKRRQDAIKDHLGGLDSSHSWSVGSHIKGRRFRFVPDLEHPRLELSWYEGMYSDIYYQEDGAFTYTHGKWTPKGNTSSKTRIYLDEVAATVNGVGYDSEGRRLVPMVIKEKIGGGVSSSRDENVFYVVEDLFKKDFKRGRGFDRATKRVLFGIPPVIATTALVVHRFIPDGEFNGGRRPYLFGGLVVSNLALYGLWAWLTTDSREYNYPKYKGLVQTRFAEGKMEIFRGGLEHDRD